MMVARAVLVAVQTLKAQHLLHQGGEMEARRNYVTII
jgi:hypothetical protein